MCDFAMQCALDGKYKDFTIYSHVITCIRRRNLSRPKVMARKNRERFIPLPPRLQRPSPACKPGDSSSLQDAVDSERHFDRLVSLAAKCEQKAPPMQTAVPPPTRNGRRPWQAYISCKVLTIPHVFSVRDTEHQTPTALIADCACAAAVDEDYTHHRQSPHTLKI